MASKQTRLTSKPGKAKQRVHRYRDTRTGQFVSGVVAAASPDTVVVTYTYVSTRRTSPVLSVEQKKAVGRPATFEEAREYLNKKNAGILRRLA